MLGRVICSALAAAAAAAEAIPPPPSCPINMAKLDRDRWNISAGHCKVFCDGTCPFHPRWSSDQPQNLTVYRLTPANVTGLVNHDTGDAAGDAGFYGSFLVLRMLDCKPPWNGFGCFLANNPVITKFVMEVDGQYGPYLKCNPRQMYGADGSEAWVDTKTWDCTYGNGVAWHGNTNGCSCKRANMTVGRDPVDHNENCSSPDADGRIPVGCSAVGWWYSTPRAGMCQPAASLGDDGCTWRMVEATKTLNATCMRDHLVQFALRQNPACFTQKCQLQPGQPVPLATLRSSCFHSCYGQVSRPWLLLLLLLLLLLPVCTLLGTQRQPPAAVSATAPVVQMLSFPLSSRCGGRSGPRWPRSRRCGTEHSLRRSPRKGGAQRWHYPQSQELPAAHRIRAIQEVSVTRVF
jgi:hypothetical protein